MTEWIDAPDEAASRRSMEEDHAIAGGVATGELRPLRPSIARQKRRQPSKIDRIAPTGIRIAVMALFASGCTLLGTPEIECVDVDQETCHRIATELLATVREEQPTKKVVRLVVHGPHGVYDMTFSDGTGQAVVP